MRSLVRALYALAAAIERLASAQESAVVQGTRETEVMQQIARAQADAAASGHSMAKAIRDRT